MKFCDKCFISREIQQVLKSVGTIGTCPTCHSTNAYVFDTNNLDKPPEIVEWFDDLVSIFTPSNKLPDSFPHKERKLLKSELLNGWNIFSMELHDSDVYEIITSICSDRYGYQPELFNDPVGITEMFDDEYLTQHSLLSNSCWERFVDSIKRDNRYHTRMLNLGVMEKMFSFLRRVCKAGTIFYRGRITEGNESLPLEEMSAPPIDKATSGRANAAGIRCLYLASDQKTTVCEVRAGAFDRVTVGEFILQRDISIVDLRAIASLCPVGITMDYLEYAVNKEHLQKINSEMGRGLRRGDNSIDYVATQYISDFIKFLEYPDENGVMQKAYQGIVYNSTMNHDGYNIAIFDPNVFKCRSTMLYSVKDISYMTAPSL